MFVKVGIATWNFSEGTLAERIERFALMEFDAVSLILRDAVAMAGGEMPDAEKAILRHNLAVTVHGGMAPRGQPVAVDSLLSDFRSIMQWHERTGALHSLNFDAVKINGVPQAGVMCQALQEMLRISRGAGFTVGVEDWPLSADQIAQSEALRSHPHLGMLIDLGHLNLRLRKGGDPTSTFPVDAARECFDSIALPINELHVHNNDGISDLHAPPTTGTADPLALATLLRAKGVDCISTIELVPAWCGLSQEKGFEAAEQALSYWRWAMTS